MIFIQQQQAAELTPIQMLMGILPVLVATFAYPLGNRKMMSLCNGRLDTFQRILGMTIASLPFWLILSALAIWKAGLPSGGQVTQSFVVAVCSGVIATTLFFIATNRVRHHQGKLASVEATQSTQVLFVMAGEAIFLSSPLPTGIAAVGILLIIAGIIGHTLNMKKMNAPAPSPFRRALHKKKRPALDAFLHDDSIFFCTSSVTPAADAAPRDRDHETGWLGPAPAAAPLRRRAPARLL